MINTQVNVQDLENEFYSKPYYLSYSGLNKMLFSPKLFYNHYILKQKEDKIESYLIDGKVIHNLLLDDGRFDQNFVLLPFYKVKDRFYFFYLFPVFINKLF